MAMSRSFAGTVFTTRPSIATIPEVIGSSPAAATTIRRRLAAVGTTARLGHGHDGVQRLHSNTLGSPFDDTKSGLGGRKRHVVGNHRLGETLESERANMFGYDASS